jgi:hypothetical protein
MYYPEIVSGALVRFKLANVVCPDSEIIWEKTTGCLEVTGRVVLLSDAGKEKNYYAVVEVNGIATPLIVPVNQVELTRDESSDRIAEYLGE